MVHRVSEWAVALGQIHASILLYTGWAPLMDRDNFRRQVIVPIVLPVPARYRIADLTVELRYVATALDATKLPV